MTPASPSSGTARAAAGVLPGLLLILAVASACSPETGSRARSAAGEGRALVVASVFPVGDLLEKLGGEAVAVRVLLPPRTSPAVFQPTPLQMREIVGAELYVEVGGGLDGWLRTVAGQSPGARVLTLTEGMALRGEGHGPGTGNPHVWLDPIRVRDHLVPAMASALVEVAPREAAAIRERSRALSDSLTALDEEVRALLAPHRGAALVASHGAWTYFAERYGLREMGPVLAGPGTEPSSRTLAALVDSARAAGVRTVFAEPQLGETAVRALAAELDVPVRILDPLGGPGVEGRDGYAALIRFNARALAEALTASGGGPP